MAFDKFTHDRVSVDLTHKKKQKLDRYCRLLKTTRAEYIREALREKMQADRRADKFRNRRRGA